MYSYWNKQIGLLWCCLLWLLCVVDQEPPGCRETKDDWVICMYRRNCKGFAVSKCYRSLSRWSIKHPVGNDPSLTFGMIHHASFLSLTFFWAKMSFCFLFQERLSVDILFRSLRDVRGVLAVVLWGRRKNAFRHFVKDSPFLAPKLWRICWHFDKIFQ